MNKAIENQLKDLILTKYKSMQAFSDATGIKYQTLVSIFNRGIHKASVTNIIRICQELNISADELAHDKIVPVERQNDSADIKDVVEQLKQSILAYKNLTCDGKQMSKNEIDMFIDGFELSYEIVKKQRERAEK